MAKALKLTLNGIKYHVTNLTKEGAIKRVGGRKEGTWEILK